MSLNTRQHRENLNVLVIGGSGSGKSRFYVKPNLMQLNTSYVVTDPKGELLRSCGRLLKKAGYEIRVFIHLDTLGDKKTALFVIIPSSDATFNFLAAMMYTQLFDTLYDTANFKYGGRLPVHVRCLLDEFANVGTIPDFDKLLATMRSMEISANIIIQNLAQLKKMYDKSWEILTGNCDSLLFLGGQEASTLEAISKYIIFLRRFSIWKTTHSLCRAQQIPPQPLTPLR